MSLDLHTREVHQISHGEVPRALRAGFAWDRTDASIVFAKDQDGNEQHDLYAIDIKTSAVKSATGGLHAEAVVDGSTQNR
jgi:hypothetical protein